MLGAFLSLAASVLDGCDGEIARLKYQESALGCWIETFGDYSYYIAIFVGLTVGAVRQTGQDSFYWIGGLALAGTLLSFALLIYLRTRITAGQPEKLHAIARDRFKAEPIVLVAHHLADLVRRHARRDALRHHGVRAAGVAARHRRARRDRREHLLDQPGPQAAPPARHRAGRDGVTQTLDHHSQSPIIILNRQSPIPKIANQQSAIYNSLRPSIALCIVTSSAYSRSLPTGTPIAMRVTRTPSGLSSLAR